MEQIDSTCFFKHVSILVKSSLLIGVASICRVRLYKIVNLFTNANYIKIRRGKKTAHTSKAIRFSVEET